MPVPRVYFRRLHGEKVEVEAQNRMQDILHKINFRI